MRNHYPSDFLSSSSKLMKTIPAMIKALLSYLERDLKWGKYFTFWITSDVKQTVMTFLNSHMHLKSTRKVKMY